jgi:hypothetical protein
MTMTTARWSLGGYAQQYAWAQCRYCGRAQSHDCPVVTCPLCSTALCFGRGHDCSVCYHGFIPGWSRFPSERECGRKGCDRPAIAKAPRVKRVCAEHAKTTQIRLAGRTVFLSDFAAEQVALRDAGKLAVGYTHWRYVQ